jgi:predicted metal-binding transcription factor (methanogenesis marker protein 9)
MDPDGEKKFLASGGSAKDVAACCRRIELAVDEALEEAFARRAKEIADREGLGAGKALSAYKALAWDCHYNMRRMLNRIEDGEMSL